MSASEGKVRLRIRTDRNDRFLLVANSEITIDELANEIKAALEGFSADEGHKYYDPSLRIGGIVNVMKEEFYVRGSDTVGELFCDQDVITCDVVLKTKAHAKSEKLEAKKAAKDRDRDQAHEEVVEIHDADAEDDAEDGKLGHKKVKKNNATAPPKKSAAEGAKKPKAQAQEFDIDAIVKGFNFSEAKSKSKPEPK